MPEDLALLARARDAFHTMLTHPVDKNAAAQSAADMRRLFSKSVALKQSRPKGTVLTRNMLTTKKPGTGLLPESIDSLVGRTLARDVSANELLTAADLV
jgi:sialic acid synthase SpsE